MGLGTIVQKLASAIGFVGVVALPSVASADEPPQPIPSDKQIEDVLETDPALKALVDQVDRQVSPGSSSQKDKRNSDGSLANPEATIRRLINYSTDAQHLLRIGWKLEFEYNPGTWLSTEHFVAVIKHPHGLEHQLRFQYSHDDRKGWVVDRSDGIPDEVRQALLIPLHTMNAEFREFPASVTGIGFRYFAPDRCQTVRTNAPALVHSYLELWRQLDADLTHHFARTDEITEAQLTAYRSHVDILRRIAQGQRVRIGGLQQALDDAERLKPQLDQRGRTLGTEVGFSCVELDQDLAAMERSLSQTQAAAAEVRDTLMAHRAIIARYFEVHPSKIPLVEELKKAPDYAAIRDVVVRIGDYAQALFDSTSQLASASATSGARAAPPKPTTGTIVYTASPRKSSAKQSKAHVSLDVVLDADKLKEMVGYQSGQTVTSQGFINKAFSWARNTYHSVAGKLSRKGKQVSVTSAAYHAPKDASVVSFIGDSDAVQRATAYTGLNALDASVLPPDMRHTVLIDEQGRCTPAMDALTTRLQTEYNTRFRKHGFTVGNVDVKNCDGIKRVTTPSTPAVQPSAPKDNRVIPGTPDDSIPPIPLEILPGATQTHNDLDALMKTYTAHTNAFSNGILNPHTYITNIRAAMSNGNNDQIDVTDGGRLARAILANEGGLVVYKYADRIVHLMQVVAETNDARALGEMHQALAEAADRSYVRRTPRVLAQVAGAALAVEQKQKAVTASLENSVATGSGPEPLTPDYNKLGTARYKADALIDNLHGALFTGNYDLAGRLVQGMSSRQIVKAELEMNRSYALTDDQRRAYGNFFEATEGLAREREALVRAQAREREYAENFAELAHGAGMKKHRLYHGVRAALIKGNIDYAYHVLRENDMLNSQDLTTIETGIDGSQLTAATRARIAQDFEGFERLAAMTTAPQGPGSAQVIPFPEKRTVAYDLKRAA